MRPTRSRGLIIPTEPVNEVPNGLVVQTARSLDAFGRDTHLVVQVRSRVPQLDIRRLAKVGLHHVDEP